ncbi:hypothetical protein NG99_01665 [Erwinia typographi]|uniref:Uncharacterized protein n=1 Tax=Erwinia typographi TaxID=371042 RepID=A0A0A3ZDJ0_9GAMM|nr:hypothetical protein NG99_01665 [Erwinia typographi]
MTAEKSKTRRMIRRPIFKTIGLFLDKAVMTYSDVLFPDPNLKMPMTIAGANRDPGRIKNSVAFGEFTAYDFRRTLATRLPE